jgi:plastocyanin
VKRLLVIPAAGIVLWAAAASCAGLATVAQRGRAFAVSSVQVARGDTVRFANEDTFLHQVYVESPTFQYESEEQLPGTNVDVRFSSAGTFTVRCHIHPKMTLQVEAH